MKNLRLLPPGDVDFVTKIMLLSHRNELLSQRPRLPIDDVVVNYDRYDAYHGADEPA